MPSQADFARSLLDPDRAVPPMIVARGNRFDIYRNNVLSSLTSALACTFPVVEKMVGSEYFAALASAFVRETPPTSRILAEYGGVFPLFIGTFPPLADFPYLADVARLEWLRQEAIRSPDDLQRDTPLASIEVEALMERKLVLAPSARLLTSPHPVATLWRLHQDPEPAQPEGWRSERVMIFRQDRGLAHAVLEEPDFVFLATLGTFETLGDALWALQDTDAASRALRLTTNLYQAGALITV
ncbi:MAG: DUF2063 domain-containing protein [Erythrobacter sp.]|nr:DUF2063 domain-containing protein [Erythrobacter sp.]MBA4163010.1 DUF2063 domain-containing protein [Erythrobacter sp.]